MPSIEYLTELCGDKDAIFAEAAKDAKIAPKKKPTLDAVLTAVVKVVERKSIEGAAALVRDDLEEAYEMYTITAGDPPGPDADEETRDAWETGVDDAVEALFQPYADVLSNDWMATNTIDTHLWEDGAYDRLAQSFGKEVFKQVCWQAGKPEEGGGKPKTPAKILASAGITSSEVMGHFADRLSTEDGGTRTPDQPTTEQMADAAVNSELDDVMDAVFERVGIDYDVDSVQEELELVMDDDELLSKGAAARLGIEDDADINTLQLLSLNEGDGAVRTLMQMLADRSLAMKDAKPAKAARSPGRKPAAEIPDGDPLVEALALLAEHGGTPNAAMAEKIGVSRATYANYVTGKTQLVPTDEQRAVLRAEIVEHVNALLQALAEVDGAQAMAVQ